MDFFNVILSSTPISFIDKKICMDFKILLDHFEFNESFIY